MNLLNFCTPHPAFGHLLPQGEGTGGRSALIRKPYDNNNLDITTRCTSFVPS